MADVQSQENLPTFNENNYLIYCVTASDKRSLIKESRGLLDLPQSVKGETYNDQQRNVVRDHACVQTTAMTVSSK